MKRTERLQWLLDYIKRTVRTTQQKSGDGPWQDVTTSDNFDALHSVFVDDYIDATGAKFVPVMLGAHRCAQLAADLKALHEMGILSRHRSGISGMGYGWPKWVWSYTLTKEGIARERI